MSNPSAVYVIMVLPISNYLRFKNAMIKNSSILANYTGKLMCAAQEVKAIEGGWPGNRTIAILYFSTEWHARQYLDSDPVVKQPDFMDGVDIVLVHLKESLPYDNPYFVIAEVRVRDPQRFVNDYSPKTAEIKDQGKVVVAASDPEPVSYRGSWRPAMIIINQWKSEKDYNAFYQSDAYLPLKELRQQISQSRVLALSN